MRLSPDSDAVIDAWRASAPDALHDLLWEALFSINGGTWYHLYEHWDDLRRFPLSVIMKFTPEEVIVWRVVPEFEGEVRVVYIGKIDH